MLILIIVFHSCRDGNVKEAISDKLPEMQKFELEWSPPQSSYGWIVIPPLQPVVNTYIPRPEEDSLIIRVRRDTIRGIAVRSPETIIIQKGEASLRGRESTDDPFYDLAFVSTNRYFGVNFDNDIFNNTDYYYTNGIRISYVSAVFASSPLAWPMLPYHKSSMNYHGMAIVQNMYTPTNPDTSNIIEGDRPFAAYLYLGHFKNSLSKLKRYRQYSELQIGLIGPGSLGGLVQSQIHEIPPLGWEAQIQNDLVLNYTALVEKGIYNPAHFDLNLFAQGRIGSLYNDLAGGLRIRAGKLNPYFSMPGLAKEESAEGSTSLRWQYGIFATAKVSAVIYNATLQGGMFNKSNAYTIAASDLERLVFTGSVGIYFAYRQLGFTYEQFYNTPEFRNALHHRWGHINITFCF